MAMLEGDASKVGVGRSGQSAAVDGQSGRYWPVLLRLRRLRRKAELLGRQLRHVHAGKLSSPCRATTASQGWKASTPRFSSAGPAATTAPHCMCYEPESDERQRGSRLLQTSPVPPGVLARPCRVDLTSRRGSTGASSDQSLILLYLGTCRVSTSTSTMSRRATARLPSRRTRTSSSS